MRTEAQTDDARWKARFRAPVTFVGLARSNPGRGIAISNRSGVFQIYAWDVASGALRQLTDAPEGKVANASIAPDGSCIYYLDDDKGNEIGHYVYVPFAGGAAQDLTPDLPPYSSFGLHIARANNLLGFNVAGAEGFHFYLAPLGADGAPGERRELFTSRKLTFGPLLSADGAVALVATSERSEKPRFSLVAFDTATGARTGELWDGPDTSVEPAMFAPLPGDARVLATADRTGDNRPLIWDPRTGERTDLRIDEIAGEVSPLDWSPDGERILLMQTHNAVQRLYVYDLRQAAARALEHPAGTFGGGCWAPDGEIWIHWQDAGHPPRLIALDGATGARKRTILEPGNVPPGRPWRSFTFQSADGQTIQGWVGVPAGTGPFPTILETHGGPSAAQLESFSPEAQAWLDHGFAYATINYRGSTTFGKAFMEQIYGDLGHWEVEDLAAAREWLIREGVARPDEIILTGWSYGGYLTLQGLGTRPELWAGGIAGAAIADWAVQYEDTADTLKAYQVSVLGGTPAEKPEVYRKSSPISYVEQVRAPVLIIQGRNDTRTPARPIEQYQRQMEALGKPIEVVWFEAGHGAFVVEQRIAHQERRMRFADRILD